MVIRHAFIYKCYIFYCIIWIPSLLSYYVLQALYVWTCLIKWQYAHDYPYKKQYYTQKLLVNVSVLKGTGRCPRSNYFNSQMRMQMSQWLQKSSHKISWDMEIRQILQSYHQLCTSWNITVEFLEKINKTFLTTFCVVVVQISSYYFIVFHNGVSHWCKLCGTSLVSVQPPQISITLILLIIYQIWHAVVFKILVKVLFWFWHFFHVIWSKLDCIQGFW